MTEIKLKTDREGLEVIKEALGILISQTCIKLEKESKIPHHGHFDTNKELSKFLDRATKVYTNVVQTLITNTEETE